MAMVVTDLDGTLLDTGSRLAEANRRALEHLGAQGSLRVVATGRSLHSADTVMAADFPIDYLVFSTGAGILDWRTRELLAVHELPVAEAQRALDELLARDLDFMVHLGIPDNHHFFYHRAGPENPDFERRCARYEPFARPLDGRDLAGLTVSQLLAVETPQSESHYESLVGVLDHLNVVLTTSPLDHRSRWIEIFAPTASKAQAAEWLRERHGVDHGNVVAVGNDYNDRDLLEWACHAFVVDNAPPALKGRHTVVASNDEEGFAQAMAARGLL